MNQISKLTRVLSVILLCLMLLSSFSSCALLKSGDDLQSCEFFGYFDTLSTVKIYESDEKELERTKAELRSLLEEYDILLDRYEQHDGTVNLYSLNQNAGVDKLTIDKKLFDAIELGKQMHVLTDGECNIALGSVIELWHDARSVALSDPDSAYVPSSEAISDALLHTDIDSVILDKDELSVCITDAALSIDLGAIAKGYVAQRTSERLLELGYEDFLINLGGNVLARGKKRDGTNWTAMIEDPLASEREWDTNVISLHSQTLVTSGSYQRFYTVGKKNYSHIVSKDDGMPPEHFVSVSILAPADSSCLADALSTALFCMDIESGKRLISSLDGVDAVWLYPDGSVYSTLEEVA